MLFQTSKMELLCGNSSRPIAFTFIAFLMVVQNYMKKINLYTTKKDLRLEFFVTYRGWGRKV